MHGPVRRAGTIGLARLPVRGERRPTTPSDVTDTPVYSQPSPVFEVLDDSGVGLTGGNAFLDERERRLVVGAANFHSLAGPGQTFRFTVVRGPSGTLPALTDEERTTIAWE